MRILLLQLLAIILPLTSAFPVSQASLRDLTSLCPSGTQYYGTSTCPSGFIGCLPPSASATICGAAGLRFSNDCASSAGTVSAGLDIGHWHACANGFRGCTTDGMVCGQPTVQVDTAPQGWVSGNGGTNVAPSPGSGEARGFSGTSGNAVPGLGAGGRVGAGTRTGSEMEEWAPQGAGSKPGNGRPEIPTLWLLRGHPAGERVSVRGNEDGPGKFEAVEG